MKLEWKNEEDIGLYECVVTDDYGCSESILIKVKHTGDYEVDYCRGYAMREIHVDLVKNTVYDLFIQACCELKDSEIEVKSWQDFK